MRNTVLSNRFSRLLAAMLLLAVTLAPAIPALAESGPNFTVKFSGVVDVVPAVRGDPWQVAGQTLIVDDATQVRLPKGPAAVGMWADVTAKRQIDDSWLLTAISIRPAEVRLKGPLTAKPEDGIGPWTVAGQTIWCTEETSLSQRSGPVEVGKWVEMHAVEDPAGTLVGVRVRGIESTEDAEVFGTIQSVSATQWILSSIPVTATVDTVIVGEPQVGLLAHAAVELAGDGLTARVFKVYWNEPTGRRQPVQLIGVVEALPADGLVGEWQVSGKTVEVSSATQIFQVKGLVELDARVHVTGLQVADRIVAASITVLSSSSGNGQPFTLHGNIEALPENGLIGAWTINGEQVQVTRQTRIHGEQYVRLGAPVEAGGVKYQNGVRVLTWARVRELSGTGPRPTEVPSPRPMPTRTPGPGKP